MKQLFTIILFISATSQTIGQSNYSFMKLMIENEKGEVLLVKWDGEWELPGEKFNKPESLTSFLDGMAASVGIKSNNYKLFGLYTQRWQGAGYLTLMHYYQASFLSGDLVVPEDCTDVAWFTKEKALEVIPYDNMKYMIRWNQEKPGKIASAAFERYKDKNDRTIYKPIENWFSLN